MPITGNQRFVAKAFEHVAAGKKHCFSVSSVRRMVSLPCGMSQSLKTSRCFPSSFALSLASSLVSAVMATIGKYLQKTFHMQQTSTGAAALADGTRNTSTFPITAVPGKSKWMFRLFTNKLTALNIKGRNNTIKQKSSEVGGGILSAQAESIGDIGFNTTLELVLNPHKAPSNTTGSNEESPGLGIYSLVSIGFLSVVVIHLKRRRRKF